MAKKKAVQVDKEQLRCERCLNPEVVGVTLHITDKKVRGAANHISPYGRWVREDWVLCEVCLKELKAQFEKFKEDYMKQGDEADDNQVAVPGA